MAGSSAMTAANNTKQACGLIHRLFIFGLYYMQLFKYDRLDGFR